MSRRSVALILGLTVGDYLLWNWSLAGNHQVIALASGLTLPPLALISLWLLAVGLARFGSRLTRGGQPAKPTGQRRQSRGYAEQTERRLQAANANANAAAAAEAKTRSRKLAA